jgi:hypothetical protein
MPFYGYRPRTSKYARRRSGSTAVPARRRSAVTYTRAAKSARSAKVTKLRTTAGRKTAIRRNTTAITSLKQQIYGPLQTQRSASSIFNVVATRPICFQVNNPGYGQFGPQLLAEHSGDDHVNAIGHFTLTNQNLMTADRDNDHRVNGPSLLLKEVDLQFRFTGYLDDTRIRVDIIRQKKAIPGHVWNPNQVFGTFMPHLMPYMQNLAGFTSNEIDRSVFQILATRKVYINSKGSANAADLLEDRNTIDGSTVNTKYCNINLKMNKVCKQLDSSVDEADGADNFGLDAHDEDNSDARGSYAFDNQHPLANIWCIVSTDDQTAFGSIVSGDAVNVSILRKCVWRDRRA